MIGELPDRRGDSSQIEDHADDHQDRSHPRHPNWRDPHDPRERAGKVRLFVNVASKCALTPQYEGLAKRREKHRDKGLTTLGLPAINLVDRSQVRMRR